MPNIVNICYLRYLPILNINLLERAQIRQLHNFYDGNE